MPGVPGPPAAGALVHSRPGRRRRRGLSRLRAHGRRHRHPGQTSAARPRRQPPGGTTVTAPDKFASVRYIVTDVQAAIDFYTGHLGFSLKSRAASAFADVVRGPLRLLL